MIPVEVAGKSVTGKVRKSNEDALRIYLDQDFVTATGRPPIFAVADGMGTYRSGADAAWMAVDQLAHFYYAPDASFHGESTLQDLFFRANQAVTDLRTDSSAHYGMGCTLTTLVFDAASGQALIIYVGDSNAWLLRGQDLRRLTIPHHDASGALTNHIGMGPGLRLDRVRFTVRPGDRLLLCSDGIDGQLPPEVLSLTLGAAPSATQAATILTQLADQAGGKDNATAIVLFFPDVPTK